MDVSVPALSTENVRPPATGTGTSLEVVFPVPSCPRELAPQQNAVPVAVSPQVWRYPAVTEANTTGVC
jgi:hypothetical protein